MKVVKWILIVLVTLVVGVIGFAYTLPTSFKVERSVLVNAPAEKVYGLVADPREWKKWSVWNQRDPAMKIDYAGPPAGPGAKWSWQSASEGNGAMEFTKAEANKSIEYVLHFADVGMSSKGTWLFANDGKATLVSWSNEGDVGKNPLYRYFAAGMDKLVGPDFEKGLANLKALAEKP